MNWVLKKSLIMSDQSQLLCILWLQTFYFYWKRNKVWILLFYCTCIVNLGCCMSMHFEKLIKTDIFAFKFYQARKFHFEYSKVFSRSFILFFRPWSPTSRATSSSSSHWRAHSASSTPCSRQHWPTRRPRGRRARCWASTWPWTRLLGNLRGIESHLKRS